MVKYTIRVVNDNNPMQSRVDFLCDGVVIHYVTLAFAQTQIVPRMERTLQGHNVFTVQPDGWIHWLTNTPVKRDLLICKVRVTHFADLIDLFMGRRAGAYTIMCMDNNTSPVPSVPTF